jgi:Thymidylate kinase
MEKILGKLFVFEGIDHVGKTSIISKLISKLGESGVPCSFYSFPGKTPKSLGALVYDIHHHESNYFSERINPISLQMLHVAAHIEILYKHIIPDIQKGKIVLLDRYWWSTYAYGIASGVSKKNLENIILPEKVIMKNIEVSGYFLIKRKNIISDYTVKKTQKILAAYDELSKRIEHKKRIIVINNDYCIDSAAAIAADIILNQRSECTQISLNNSRPEKKIIKKTININKISLETSIIYNAYWKFACERQKIFFNRYKGQSAPWTDDIILQKYKFTNAYRASDRVSQFLIRNVIYNPQNTFTPEDMIFRIILFKLFNRIETWNELESNLGGISFRNYDYEKYNKILTSLLLKKHKIYSAAYIMPSGKSSFGFDKKHENNLKLLEYIMNDNISRKVSATKSMRELYELLISYPTIGKFLAFQYAIDINYSELCDFDEMSFVVVGPGAQQGIKKCFKNSNICSEEDIVRYMTESQDKEFDSLGLKFQTLWGRQLQLIDCQNLFCEIDKYSRVAYPKETVVNGRKRIKQQFRPNFSKTISYFYPPKWGINDLIPR